MALARPQVFRSSIRVLEDSFDLKAGEIVCVSKTAPEREQLVVVVHEGVKQVARYRGPHVELRDRTLTWIYKLLWTVDRRS